MMPSVERFWRICVQDSSSGIFWISDNEEAVLRFKFMVAFDAACRYDLLLVGGTELDRFIADGVLAFGVVCAWVVYLVSSMMHGRMLCRQESFLVGVCLIGFY